MVHFSYVAIMITTISAVPVLERHGNTSLYLARHRNGHYAIVAKCPRMAGTVPEFRPMSQPC